MCGGLLIVLKIVAMLAVGRNQIGPSTHEHDRSMTLCSHPNDQIYLLRAAMATTSPLCTPSSSKPNARLYTFPANCPPVRRRWPSQDIVAGELQRRVDIFVKHWQMWPAMYIIGEATSTWRTVAAKAGFLLIIKRDRRLIFNNSLFIYILELVRWIREEEW